jgi:hypothetical protein
MARLQSGRLDLRGQDQSESFDLDEPESRPVRVRVSRQTDAVLSLEGRLLTPDEAAKVDADALGIDGLGNVVHQYRRLEIYLVEAESPARRPFGAVRLLAAVARLDTGRSAASGCGTTAATSASPDRRAARPFPSGIAATVRPPLAPSPPSRQSDGGEDAAQAVDRGSRRGAAQAAPPGESCDG